MELYRRTCAAFQWNIPRLYNAGQIACGQYAESEEDTALTIAGADGQASQYSYGQLNAFSNKLANYFKALGLSKGDRVGFLLPASFQAAAACMAALKSGLVIVPIFTGVTAGVLGQRVAASGLRVLLIGTSGSALVEEIASTIQERSVKVVPLVGPSLRNHDLLETLTAGTSSAFETVGTTPNDPAFLAFTSGSEGVPKGVLHAHRELIGATSTFGLRTRPFGKGEVTWSPADWSWLMGLNVAFCAWYSGGSVLLQEASVFDPGQALKLMADFGVQHASLMPTALTLIQKTDKRIHHPALRTLATGGETLGGEIFDWVRERFGIPLDEFFGMSECPALIGNGDIVESRRGALGVALPGHDVQVVDEQGEILPDGDLGYIAVNKSDPGMFLGYWRDMELIPPEFRGNYYLTSDLARKDVDGYFWHVGRGDDVIKSGGYRIGPGEIEDCAASHPRVQLAGAVSHKDNIVGQVVKLWIQLKAGDTQSAELEKDIRQHIQQRLPSYQWPRRIEFIANMPLTSSGKINRRELRELN
jgi:acetyl-CoA synthetase